MTIEQRYRALWQRMRQPSRDAGAASTACWRALIAEQDRRVGA